MSFIDFILLLIVSGVVGSIGESIAGSSRGGFLVASAIGFIGAMIGVYLAKHFRLPELFVVHIGSSHFPIIWSIIGSTLFVIVVSFLTRRTV